MQFLGFQCVKVWMWKLQLPETAGTHLLLLLYARCCAGGVWRQGVSRGGGKWGIAFNPPPPDPLLVKRQFKLKSCSSLWCYRPFFLDIILNFLQCMYVHTQCMLKQFCTVLQDTLYLSTVGCSMHTACWFFCVDIINEMEYVYCFMYIHIQCMHLL